MSARSFDVDALLPCALERLEFAYRFQADNSRLPIEQLPKGLKKIPKLLFSAESDADKETVLKRFSNLEYAEVHFESALQYISERLQTLISEKPLFLDFALPRGLTELNLCLPPPSSNLKHIPSSLTSLNIASSRITRVYSTPEVIEKFPPWTMSDFSHFADQMRLTSLFIEWKFVYSGSCLAPLSKLQTLKIFKIDRISLQGWLDSPEWLLKCLPSSLTELKLNTAGIESDIPVMAPKENFSPILGLDKVTPHLKLLELYCNEKVGLVLSAELFASLPRRLLKMDCQLMMGSLSLNAVAQLPRSLQYLALSLSPIYQSEQLSDDHFEGLPPSLAEFALYCFSPMTSITPKLVDLLPKSVSMVHGMDTPQFRARLNELFLSNPISEGFRTSTFGLY